MDRVEETRAGRRTAHTSGGLTARIDCAGRAPFGDSASILLVRLSVVGAHRQPAGLETVVDDEKQTTPPNAKLSECRFTQFLALSSQQDGSRNGAKLEITKMAKHLNRDLSAVLHGLYSYGASILE
jgi:hypothetical protein